MTIYTDKITTRDLRIGMYVCKLDRPWLDTPFPFQGFYIRSKCEIKELGIFCKYVYVDAKKGHSLYNQVEISKPSPLLLKKKKKIISRLPADKFRYSHINIGKYSNIKSPFKKELVKAKDLYYDLSSSMQQINFNLRTGNYVDLNNTIDITKKIVKGVIRNPDSHFCLSRLKEKSNFTYNHSLRSCILATVFGRYLGLIESDLYRLATGVLFADIGKTKINRDLLRLQEKPTTSQTLIYKSHVEKGVEILAENKEVDHEALIITETHHERYEGSGYPYGLIGEEIPYFGQIAGIVDVFDAITNKKAYGQLMSTTQAIDWLHHQKGKLFSSQLVDDFIQAIGLYPAGTKVELSDSSIAVVMSHNHNKRLRPEILLISDRNNKKLKKPKKIDLSKKSFLFKKQRPLITRALI
jgi:HD-GYP domain-containing protein (c-di-GMP phosphodiesterase class II)